jgi:hypothetical protein
MPSVISPGSAWQVPSGADQRSCVVCARPLRRPFWASGPWSGRPSGPRARANEDRRSNDGQEKVVSQSSHLTGRSPDSVDSLHVWCQGRCELGAAPDAAVTAAGEMWLRSLPARHAVAGPVYRNPVRAPVIDANNPKRRPSRKAGARSSEHPCQQRRPLWARGALVNDWFVTGAARRASRRLGPHRASRVRTPTAMSARTKVLAAKLQVRAELTRRQ